MMYIISVVIWKNLNFFPVSEVNVSSTSPLILLQRAWLVVRWWMCCMFDCSQTFGDDDLEHQYRQSPSWCVSRCRAADLHQSIGCPPAVNYTVALLFFSPFPAVSQVWVHPQVGSSLLPWGVCWMTSTGTMWSWSGSALSWTSVWIKTCSRSTYQRSSATGTFTRWGQFVLIHEDYSVIEEPFTFSFTQWTIKPPQVDNNID